MHVVTGRRGSENDPLDEALRTQPEPSLDNSAPSSPLEDVVLSLGEILGAKRFDATR